MLRDTHAAGQPVKRAGPKRHHPLIGADSRANPKAPWDNSDANHNSKLHPKISCAVATMPPCHYATIPPQSRSTTRCKCKCECKCLVAFDVCIRSTIALALALKRFETSNLRQSLQPILPVARPHSNPACACTNQRAPFSHPCVCDRCFPRVYQQPPSFPAARPMPDASSLVSRVTSS